MNAVAHECLSGWLENSDGSVYRCPECVPAPRLEVAHARKTDPIESHVAAASVKVSVSEDFVHGVLKDIGKAVLDEDLIEFIRTSYPEVTYTDSRIRTARGKLVEKGLARFAGRGRTKRDQVASLFEAVPE